VSQFYAVHHVHDDEHEKVHHTAATPLAVIGRLWTAARQLAGWASTRTYAVVLRLLCTLRVLEDLDAINECLDCGSPFSLWCWRRICAGCENGFCAACLKKQHIVDTIHRGNESAPRVCSFCFFTHCAKFCGAKCCEGLPVREVKKFLSRKGISMLGALEKRELLDSIQNWALELANAEDFVVGDDIESVIRIQDAECSTTRASTPYCGNQTSEEPFLDSLPVSELRARLQALGVQCGGILEKRELVQYLLQAHATRF